MPAPIGTRYTRHHVIRRDTTAGTYEEVNSPLETRTERAAQLALLAKQPAPRWAAIFGFRREDQGNPRHSA